MFAQAYGKNLLCQLYTIKMTYQGRCATGNDQFWLVR
jgi:hypothetical protein